ncbi:YveK family protein [Algibacter pacificus]|uniref:hypothetical protein n=1 Tax=Algibacter pacificus TaxID=2599389 RepID=UPI0011C9737C|nr:hypothetical protein [Algibacter pacificus]
MSKESPQLQQSEEIDLVKLFNLIGNLFERLFKFIGSIVSFLFSIFIYALKAIILNFKIILISVLVAAAIGYGLEKTQSPVYKSHMLVRPYFESKFQLVTNINYYNALIEDNDYQELSNLFQIDNEAANSLVEFTVQPGPETENERILQYDRFIRAVDSVRAQEISYEDFLANRSVYSGEFFEIGVKAHNKDIFRALEEGINSTFSNNYSVKKMKKRDSLISLSRARIQRDLVEVDSLKRMYISLVQKESTADSPLSYKEGSMALVQERVKTKEYELLDKELELRNELTQLDAQQVEEDVYFDIISSFQEVGSVHKTFLDKYSFIFPIIVFILLCLLYLGMKLVKFVITYEK